MGIHGNELADAAAKAALSKEVQPMYVPHSDFKTHINTYIQKLWQEKWDTQVRNKLHQISPRIGENSVCCRSRKEQVVISRLRLGHTRLTHSHLMNKEPAPRCEKCLCPLTVSHVLLDCNKFCAQRSLFLNDYTSIKEIFSKISCSDIVSYLRATALISEI